MDQTGHFEFSPVLVTIGPTGKGNHSVKGFLGFLDPKGLTDGQSYLVKMVVFPWVPVKASRVLKDPRKP